MPSVEYDLRYLQDAADELDRYLISDELFWPVTAQPPEGEADYPRLTLGGLLLAHARLRRPDLKLQEQARLIRLETQIETTRFHWQAAWNNKTAREFASRINQWRNYLEEYRQNPDLQADFYPYEVRWRVLLALLDEEGQGIDPEQLELLRTLDMLHEAVFVKGEFIWETELQPCFPSERFWYLYGRLRKEARQT